MDGGSESAASLMKRLAIAAVVSAMIGLILVAIGLTLVFGACSSCTRRDCWLC